MNSILIRFATRYILPLTTSIPSHSGYMRAAFNWASRLLLIMTVEGNRAGYTDKQYERAKRAWKLYVNTGGGVFDNFKHYLRQNLI